MSELRFVVAGSRDHRCINDTHRYLGNDSQIKPKKLKAIPSKIFSKNE